MAATERITVVVCGEKLKQMMGGKGHGGGLGVEVGVGRVGGGVRGGERGCENAAAHFNSESVWRWLVQSV